MSSRISLKVKGAMEYLALIAIRQNLDPSKFFDCIREAWNRGRSKCEAVMIACLEKRKDSAVFLFTLGSDVVAQFPIGTEILKGENVLEMYVARVAVRSQPVAKDMPLKIKDLRPRMTGVDLRAKVVEISEPKVVETGSGGIVSIVLIADETGSITMSLWNGQINLVSEGDLIEIKNARVDRFRGELQLRLPRYSRIILLERSKEMKDEG